MEVSIQNLSTVSREVEIAAAPEELKEHFDRAYEEQRKTIEIKGFRKGKAPLELVKKLYGDLIEQDSLQTIASALYRQVVKEKDLKPIGEPTLVDLDYKKGERLMCKVRYDIRPEVKLKEYRNIPVDKPVHTVTEQEIEQEILRLQRINATMESAEKVDGPEYVVTVTLQDLDDSGTPLIGKKTENVRFYLADEQLEQPFKDALRSAAVGDAPTVRFEHAHEEHTHTVNTRTTVTKVERVVLPPLDDAFVSKITKDKMKTAEELRAGLREDVASYWKTRSDRHVLNSIIAEIVRRHDFEVPESLVHSVLNGLMEEIKQEQPGKHLPPDFDEEKFRNENHAYAVYQSKWALLREEILKAENLTVEDADLVALAEEESTRTKIDKERLVNYYRSSEQVKDRLVGDKLIRMLVDSAKVREVPENEH